MTLTMMAQHFHTQQHLCDAQCSGAESVAEEIMSAKI